MAEFNKPSDKSLCIEYLGMELRVPGWEVVVMAPPGIAKIAGLIESDFQQEAMVKSATYGFILKIGDRAYEKWCLNTDGTPNDFPFPYHVGQWVFFEAFRPELRVINGNLISFIPDIRNVCEIPQEDLEYWDVYVAFEEGLAKKRERALAWRALSREERKKQGCKPALIK